MEQISVFDMLSIGVGPSSSHTLGSWRAAQQWVGDLQITGLLHKVIQVNVTLYGSLSLTGKGHATDIAVLLGLLGEDPICVDVARIPKIVAAINDKQEMEIGSLKKIPFLPDRDIVFESTFLPFHPNGIQFKALLEDGTVEKEQYYSIGGGFIVREGESIEHDHCIPKIYPYPVNTADELSTHCNTQNKAIWEIVLANENSCKTADEISEQLMRIWGVMQDSIYIGCHTKGVLPGRLKVKRRAFDIHHKLIKGRPYNDQHEWIETIRKLPVNFHEIFRWVSCFALAVNEVNASLGRVVTAPTNGSAGVIPAVLFYYICFVNKFAGEKEIQQFLLTAGEIGSIFKKGSTISAALGGCQAEIGVSSAMAAAALTELLGGTADQALVAAEIAMEHHLGLTCDPVDGLVQVPCIERNAMGAIKAINATELALDTNPEDTLVPLDKVISTMWETAQSMHNDYKETSKGGLAVAVNITDC